MTEQPEPKYVVELRKNYYSVQTKEGYTNIAGGEWEILKDEFGCDRVFDFYFQAYRELQTQCPAITMFGGSVGRVKEVEMIHRKKQDG